MKLSAPDIKKVHLAVQSVLSKVFFALCCLMQKRFSIFSHTSSMPVNGLRRVIGPLIYCTVVTGAKAKKTLI